MAEESDVEEEKVLVICPPTVECAAYVCSLVARMGKHVFCVFYDKKNEWNNFLNNARSPSRAARRAVWGTVHVEFPEGIPAPSQCAVVSYTSEKKGKAEGWEGSCHGQAGRARHRRGSGVQAAPGTDVEEQVAEDLLHAWHLAPASPTPGRPCHGAL